MSPSVPERLAAAAARRATQVASQVGSRLGRSSDVTTARQTVTFGTGIEELEALFTDPGALSRIAGEVGSVAGDGERRYAWTFVTPGDDDAVEVPTTLTQLPGVLRWTSDGGDDGPAHEAEIRMTPAPNDLGTEVTLEVEVHTAPIVPSTLTSLALGGALFKALHRAKALVETGEIPTLEHNPAARNGGADHDED